HRLAAVPSWASKEIPRRFRSPRAVLPLQATAAPAQQLTMAKGATLMNPPHAPAPPRPPARRRNGLAGKREAMKPRLPRVLWVLLLAIAGVAVYAGNAQATPSSGFVGMTTAKATYGRILSHVQTQDPQFWNEVMNMVGTTDLYVQQNTWDPSTCGG